MHSLKRIMVANKYFNDLPTHHKALLPHFKENLCDIRVCIEHNAEIIKLIIAGTEDMFENKKNEVNGEQVW